MVRGSRGYLSEVHVTSGLVGVLGSFFVYL